MDQIECSLSDTFLLTFTKLRISKMLTHPGCIYQSPQENPTSAIDVSVHGLTINPLLYAVSSPYKILFSLNDPEQIDEKD